MTCVMLIEDNIGVLESIAFELEMRGYEVMTAVNGRDAIEKLSASTRMPNVIVSDIAMPDMDGFQLLETVQRYPQWNTIPFLFLTAFSSPATMRLSKELGVDDYLVKPFQADDLVIAIENKMRRIRQFHDGEARKVDDARRELLKLVSHEMRTPLTSIFGGAELLADSLSSVDIETNKQLLGFIQNGADRLKRFVEQVELLVQLDSGYITRMVERDHDLFDLNDLVQKAVAKVPMSLYIVRDDVKLVPEYSSEPAFVNGVSGYIQFAVNEVVRNGLMYALTKTEVPVRVVVNDKEVSLVVQNRFKGIEPQDLPRVWDRFVQLDRDVDEHQGTGLGLALTRGLVEANGGTCTLTSEPWEWTTVTLTFPRAKPDVSE